MFTQKKQPWTVGLLSLLSGRRYKEHNRRLEAVSNRSQKQSTMGAGASKLRTEPGSGASAPETEGESDFADPGRLAFAVSHADQARLPDALTW